MTVMRISMVFEESCQSQNYLFQNVHPTHHADKMARKRKHSNEEFQDVNEERRRVGESVAAVAEATSVVSPASSTDQRFESLYAHPRDFKELAQLDSDFAAV